MAISNIDSLDPVILSSFEALKRSARTEADIAAWFKARPFLLDPLLGTTDLPVIVALQSKDHMGVFKTSDPEHAHWLTLTMGRHKAPGAVTPFLLSMQGTSSVHSSGAEQWSINIKLSEWSFIVAKIAARFVRELLWVQYPVEQQAAGRAFLETQLPRHFSGLKPEALRAMVQGGLIEDVSLDKTQVRLFELRVSNVAALPVPDDLSSFRGD